MKKHDDLLILSNQAPGVPEIFYSIQGEGPEIGRPSIFIRFSGCNLYCHWCDTAYTWNWAGTKYQHKLGVKYVKKDEQTPQTIDQLVTQIKQFPCENIVLTGGEPLAQQKTLALFMETLAARGLYNIDVETNATIKPDALFDQFIAKYVCSPKLTNAKVPEKLRIQAPALRWFSQSDKSYFKFVVSSLKDFEEIETLIKKFSIVPDRVYIMAEGINEKAIAASQSSISSVCLERGYRYTDRLHVRLYGDKRGV